MFEMPLKDCGKESDVLGITILSVLVDVSNTIAQAFVIDLNARQEIFLLTVL